MRARISPKTGPAIRKLRLARGWNLATLSENSGIPISTLSRVELGQNALNYDKLIRLCRALEVDIDGLLQRDVGARPAVSGRRSVTRAGAGEPTSLAGHAGLAASTDLLGRSLSPAIFELVAGDEPQWASFEAEVYLLVLAGSVVVETELYAPLALGLGDALTLDAGAKFVLKAQPSARVLAVAAGEVDFSA